MQKKSRTNASLLFPHTFLADKTMWLMEIGFYLPRYQVLPLLLDKATRKSCEVRKALENVWPPFTDFNVRSKSQLWVALLPIFLFLKSSLFLIVMLKWIKEIPKCVFCLSDGNSYIWARTAWFGGKRGCGVEVLLCTCLLAAAFLQRTELAITKAALNWPCAFISMSCIRPYAPAHHFPFLCPPLLSVS